jgi:urea transporter
VNDQDDRLLERIALQNWLVLAVFVAMSMLWRSLPITLGVVTGGLVALLSYRWLHRSLKRILSQPDDGSARGFQAGYLLRLVALAMIIFLLLTRLKVHPLGLVAGLSVVIVSLLSTTLIRFLKRKQ